MSTKIVIEGYLSKGNSEGSVSILLLDGSTIEVRHDAIVRSAPMDAGNDALTRLFLEPEAEISFSIRAKDLHGQGGASSGTILKWVDDGGTLRKSMDDNQAQGSTLKWVDDGGTIRKSLDDG